jgi:hypothetical protein
MLVLGEQPHWHEYAAMVLIILALATVLVPPRIRQERRQVSRGTSATL